jgi:hypothetical protein
MRKTIFAMVASLMLLAAPVIAQKETPLVGIMKETGKRVSLVDGNQLYAWCQDAQDTFKIEADNSINIRPGSGHSAVVDHDLLLSEVNQQVGITLAHVVVAVYDI